MICYFKIIIYLKRWVLQIKSFNLFSISFFLWYLVHKIHTRFGAGKNFRDHISQMRKSTPRGQMTSLWLKSKLAREFWGVLSLILSAIFPQSPMIACVAKFPRRGQILLKYMCLFLCVVWAIKHIWNILSHLWICNYKHNLMVLTRKLQTLMTKTAFFKKNYFYWGHIGL